MSPESGQHQTKDRYKNIFFLKKKISFWIREEVREEIFKKGQSKRIWGELYKVSFLSYHRRLCLCVDLWHEIVWTVCTSNHFLPTGDWFLWCHHPSPGRSWSHRNSLRQHRDVSEEGETLETSDICAQQMWSHPHLGHGNIWTTFCPHMVGIHVWRRLVLNYLLALFSVFFLSSLNLGSRSAGWLCSPRNTPRWLSTPASPTPLVKVPSSSCSDSLAR